MFKYFKILLFFAVIFAFVSCREEGLAGDIKQLKDDAEDCLVDMQTYKPNDLPVKEGEKYIKILQAHFSQFDKYSRKVLVDLSNTDKARKKVTTSTSGLQERLEFSIKQLKALYTEVKQNTINQDSAKIYFLQEQAIYKEVELYFVGIKDSQKRIQNDYKRLIPKSKHIADSLLNSVSIVE